MDYRILGRSGLRVSELCLGTMTFGSDWGWGADREASREMFTAFAAAGGNFIDSSNNYTDGTSETLLGEFLAGRREQFVLATKYTLSLDPRDPNAGGNHRKSLVRSLEQSLERLRTDYVDVLWLHMHDSFTPIDEAVRALDDQIRLGKVLHVGISDSPSWIAARANTLAELRGWSPFVALQVPYSLATRDAERELLPMADSFGLAVTPWGVLDHGTLSSKKREERRWRDDPISEQAAAALEVLAEIAEMRGCSVAQAAIAWILQRPFSSPMIPIVAGRTREQIVDNLGAVDVRLDAAEIERLDEATKPSLGFPRSFLESDGVRGLIYGETYSAIKP